LIGDIIPVTGVISATNNHLAIKATVQNGCHFKKVKDMINCQLTNFYENIVLGASIGMDVISDL
jgi:hypothetical protein